MYREEIQALLAATGDTGKPVLIAICLIVSIVLMIALIVTGRYVNKKNEDEDEDER